MNILRIQELREAAHLTQVALADRVGVTQSVISDWERETYLPKTRQLPDLAKLFHCSIDDLFNPVNPER